MGQTMKSDDRGSPPSGRITLVFTDVEGSTEMGNALGSDYFDGLLKGHNERIRRAEKNIRVTTLKR